jgi:hypothetical protein
VFATFGLGRRLVSPAGGVLAAALVATSPIVLQSSVVMLSDLPTAGAWAAALYFVTRKTHRSALSAGFAAALAVLTRPNHLPLAAILALTYVDRLRDAAGRKQAIQHLMLFSAAAASGIGATAAINAVIYGSPFMSGYGPLSGYFSLSNVTPNLWRYPAWIAETQTPLALVGLAALLLPVKRVWPGASRPAAVLVPALFALTLLGLYLIYAVFDAWWYLRFVLALWPPMMVGAAAVLVLLLRSRWVLLRIAAAFVLVAVTLFQITNVTELGVFDTWKDERRYIGGALMTARYTVPNSVVMSMQHSGSVRYYGGRMTMRYDAISRDHVDDAVAWFNARGIHVYLLAEDWELSDLERWWAGTRALDAAKAQPVAVYLPGGRLFLFDLTSPGSEAGSVHYSTDIETGLSVPGPVDVPPLVIHEP